MRPFRRKPTPRHTGVVMPASARRSFSSRAVPERLLREGTRPRSVLGPAPAFAGVRRGDDARRGDGRVTDSLPVRYRFAFILPSTPMSVAVPGNSADLPPRPAVTGAEDRRYPRFRGDLPSIKINDLGSAWQGFLASILD